MNTKASLAGVLVLAALALAACDAQEKSSYQGDPMWSMKGSLISENFVASDTEVAILWDGEDVQVLESVEVEGNFPAEFTLRTYEAPPAKGVIDLSLWDIDAKFGVGNIVAVDSEAPLYPKLINKSGDSLPASFELEQGETLIASDEQPWLRGGVPAYIIVYFEGSVPESFRCLSRYEPGYNLVALREFTDAEVAAVRACRQTTFEQALAEYNQTHGTDYTKDTLDEDRVAAEEVDFAAGVRACTAGCELFKAHSSLVNTDRRVTLELERDVEFVDWN